MKSIMYQEIQALEEQIKNLEKDYEPIFNEQLTLAEKDLDNRLNDIVSRVVTGVQMMVGVVGILFGITKVPCDARSLFFVLTLGISLVSALFVFGSVMQIWGYRKHFEDFDWERAQNSLFTKLDLKVRSLLRALGLKVTVFGGKLTVLFGKVTTFCGSLKHRYLIVSTAEVVEGMQSFLTDGHSLTPLTFESIVIDPTTTADSHDSESTTIYSQPSIPPHSVTNTKKVASIWLLYLGPTLAYIVVPGVLGILFSSLFGMYLFDLRCVQQDAWYYGHT